MASVTNRAQQFFSRMVPEWVHSKVGVGKTAAFAVLAFAAFVALAVVWRRRLSGRFTIGAVRNLRAPDNKTKTEPEKTDKDGGTKTELIKTEPVKTPPTSPSKQIKVRRDVGYGNTLFVNGSPMKNDGTSDGWTAVLDGFVPEKLTFSINDPSNPIEAPVIVEEGFPPSS